MSRKTDSKPYLESWLGRIRRQLALSGKLSELVMILSRDSHSEESEIDWRAKLQRVLDGEEEPGFELLFRIDSILARPVDDRPDIEEQTDLFQ